MGGAVATKLGRILRGELKNERSAEETEVKVVFEVAT